MPTMRSPGCWPASMPETLEKIADFLRGHHVLTLAVAHGNVPYCAPLFYAYDRKRNVFVFASDVKTEHIRLALSQPEVAAAVYLETETVGKIEGLQIRGTVTQSETREDRALYFDAFPYARVLQPTLWRLQPSWMKLTDNRLGFGKKLLWNADGE